MAENVGVIGSGVVGQTLADGFLKHGFNVMRGTRDPAKLALWKQAAGAHASVGSFVETARFGKTLVLAVKGTAAEAAVKSIGPENLAGKTVIDTTNPIADEPPQNGVLRYFTDINESLMERLQRLAPQADFVKAFSCSGNSHMVNPDFGGVKPTMFICGNSAQAKDTTTSILTRFGWEVEDMGGVEGARAIEPLAILWCIPGFLRKQWGHTFKLLKR
jgi:8-hydroxy-5-deazaflavin:NADPH oxidoreductase